MNPPSSGPPNPRHARYRQMPVHWSVGALTIGLIAICVIVAAISQLGYNTKPVAWMFFAEPPALEQMRHLQEQLDRMEERRDTESPQYEQLIEQIDEIQKPNPRPFEQISQGQVWRAVTPIFLHFGPIHLLFNMMWLWTLGRPLEFLLRRTGLGLLVLAIAVVSNVAQALINGPNFGGMSGVVYGMIGFIFVHSKLHPTGGLQLNPRTMRYMLIWLVACFTGFLGPIANWAHLFGLLAGGAVGAANALTTGGWQTLRRRHEFRRAIASTSGAIHQCAVCGKTEHHDPDLEFRVGTDGNEYCEHHQPGTSSPS